MKTWKSLSALLLGLAFCSFAGSQPASQSPGDAKRIDALVKQLGSSKYLEREQAQKELEAIGAPALDVLRKAARGADAEIGKRAGDMVRRLEDKINTEKLLAPKKVKLSFKNTPVAEAVAELAKQSGYAVKLENAAALGDRRVTLETGEVSFFEALDKLCAKAGLIEKAQVGATAIPIGPRPIIRPGVKIGPNVVPQPIVPVPGIIPAPAPAPAQPPQVIPPKAAPPASKAPAAPQQLGQFDFGAAGLAEAMKALEAQLQGQFPPGQQVNPDMDRIIKEAQAQLQAQRKLMEAQMQAQLAQIQAQIQAQQLPLVPQIPQIQFPQVPGFQPGFPGGGFGPAFGPAQQQQPRQFILTDGKPVEYPTSYFGAVRVRLLPPASARMKAQPGEVLLVFEVTAEPSLQNFQVTGTPSIVRALDDQGQLLATVEQPGNNPNPAVANPAIRFPNPFNPHGSQQRLFTVRLKVGEKQAKSLKELNGTMTVSVQQPVEPVAAIENVLKAAGQSAKHKDTKNDVLTLQSIEKVGDNGYKVQVTMEGNAANPQNPFGVGGNVQIIVNGQVQIGGFGALNGTSQSQPALLDAKGKAYQIVGVPAHAMHVNNGVIKRTMTIEYRANDGQGEPARLVISEARNATLAVPFSFKNVPIAP